MILIGRQLPTLPFHFRARGEQSRGFEDLLRKEGRKTATRPDFVLLGLDQATLQMPPLSPEELAEQSRLSAHDRATLSLVTRSLGHSLWINFSRLVRGWSCSTCFLIRLTTAIPPSPQRWQSIRTG